ncbi:hypothetical protein JCM15519_27570 [Fundidesulfovibrio butyratiphilus]
MSSIEKRLARLESKVDVADAIPRVVIVHSGRDCQRAVANGQVFDREQGENDTDFVNRMVSGTRERVVIISREKDAQPEHAP